MLSVLLVSLSFIIFPPGHGKFETLGALGISTMLLATAGGIAWHTLDLLLVYLQLLFNLVFRKFTFCQFLCVSFHIIEFIVQGLMSADPQTFNQSLTHEHGHSHRHGGHHHGIDMEHPILALSMTIVSISVKEG